MSGSSPRSVSTDNGTSLSYTQHETALPPPFLSGLFYRALEGHQEQKQCHRCPWQQAWPPAARGADGKEEGCWWAEDREKGAWAERLGRVGRSWHRRPGKGPRSYTR